MVRDLHELTLIGISFNVNPFSLLMDTAWITHVAGLRGADT